MPLQPVKPGDLIKAEEWNRLLEDIRLLEARVASLENNDARVEILDLQFTAPLRVGATLIIAGRNFRTPTHTARVFLDGREVQPDPDSFTNARMEIVIPDDIAPPAAGRQVQLLVSNVITSDQRNLTILPRQIELSGPIQISWEGVDPLTLRGGSDVFWEYTALSRASTTATFTIAPRITPANLIAQNLFQVFAANRTTPIPNGQITLPQNQTKPLRFFLRLNPFPNLADRTQFTLSVELRINGQTYTVSDPERFTVGEATTQPDETIDLSISAVEPETVAAGPVWIRPNSIQFRAGVAQVQVQLIAVFEKYTQTEITTDTIYRLNTSKVAGWTVDDSDNPREFTVKPEEFRSGRPITRSINYYISPAAGVVMRTLTVGLQREGATASQEITLELRPQ